MQLIVEPNGRHRVNSKSPTENRAPIFFIFFGSLMNLAARYLWHLFGEWLRGAFLLSMDTTGQRDHPEVPHLPEELFINLAESADVTPRLRAALNDPRIASWITQKVTEMNPGPGAGAEPLLARFLLEDSLDDVISRIGGTIQKIEGPRRAEFASKLQNNRFSYGMSYNDSPHVVFITGSSGASGSLALPVRRLFERLLPNGAKYHLVLTLPSPSGDDAISVQKRRKLAFARSQELSDSFAGGDYVYRPSDELEITTHGPLFDGIYLMPEPLPSGLDEQARFVGELLGLFLQPAGKAIIDTTIDKTSLSHCLGPLGQPGFLSRLGSATLRGAPHEIILFAKAVLGRCATQSVTSDQDSGSTEFCDRVGLTRKHTFECLQSISKPDVSRISAKASGVFEKNAAGKMAGERGRLVHSAIGEFKQQCHTATREFQHCAEQMAVELGAEAVESFARSVGQKIESLRECYLAGGAAEIPKVASSNGTLEKRIETVWEREEALAKREFSSSAVTILAEFAAVTNETWTGARERAKLYREAEREYDASCREMGRPAKFSVLSVATLSEYIESQGHECTEAVRRACWNLSNLSKFHETVDAIVTEFAEPFRRLQRIDEALQVASESPEDILQRVLAAAVPGVRVDPLWDVKKNASRVLFTTMPSSHTLASRLGGLCAEVKYAASSCADIEWTFVTIDYGLEIGALLATREAREAYFADPDPDFPPFLERDYQAKTRLWSPPQDEWFACIAIALRLHLADGSVTRGPRGWYFEGTHLGADYIKASRGLRKRENRIPGLPSFEDLSKRTEDLLLGDGDVRKAIKILKGVAEKLRKELSRLESRKEIESAKERLIRDEELSATEFLIERYERLADDLDAHKKTWDGDGGGNV